MDKQFIRILMIEDDEADVAFVRDVLQENNASPSFDLVSRDRLKAGLEFLSEESVDLVLLDLSLPDSQGLETIAPVYEKISGTPIIVLTGRDNEALGVDALKQGAHDYLLKWRIDSNFIIRAMRYALERCRLLSALDQAKQNAQIEAEKIENLRNFQHYVAISNGGAASESLPKFSAKLLLDEFTPQYRQIVLKYIRALRIQESRPSREVRELAGTLAASGFQARDVVRMHLQVLNEFAQRAMPDEEREFSNDARLVLVELMGVLTDLYFERAALAQHDYKDHQ